MKGIFTRILNRKRGNKAFNDILEEIRVKPIIPEKDERRFRDAIANLDLRKEQENELSLYNFKLAGLISGKDHSYISIVNSGGEVLTLTLGQYLGKIQLVDLRLTEAIFKKDDGKFMIIDFNNQVRESDDY